MTALQKTIVGAALATAVGTGIYEWKRASDLQVQVQKLEQQQVLLAEQLQQVTQERDEANSRVVSLAVDADRLDRGIADMRLRNEVSMLRGNPRASPRLADAGPLPVAATAEEVALQESIAMGRDLGMAVVRGDPGAWEKVAELAKARLQSFRTNSAGMNDTLRGDFQRRTFAPLTAAFDVISEAATQGNPLALDAVVQAALFPELKGQAIKSLGKLAGDGNEAALDILLNRERYGFLLSSTVGALVPAAENGNQKAIDALTAVAGDANHQALWLMTADGLSKPAESGNVAAIDALVAMSVSTNKNLRNAIVLGLRKAAAKGNVKAAEALRSTGN
jgi:hypothetical protein